jgi:hypothetical protein
MTQRMCDCVLSQNGLGMSGRECNCGNDENAALDRAAAAEIERLREALEKALGLYVELVGSGDCGTWDVEAEPEVIAARAILAKHKEKA